MATGMDDKPAFQVHHIVHQAARQTVLFAAQTCNQVSPGGAECRSAEKPMNTAETAMDSGDLINYPQPDSNRCMQTENLLS